ncbi:MAG: HpcH/HpaI aldolase family protein [bacterium]
MHDMNSEMIAQLRGGQRMYGTMLRLIRSSAIAPIARHAGLDFIMLDMEHGAYDWQTVADVALQAQAEGVAVMVRVPELSKHFVSGALDCGVQGVMVPMLETIDEAEALAAWAKYPPAGRRGLGSSGGHTRYRKMTDVPAMVRSANEGTIAIAQIETQQAVENATKIAQVPGIDAMVMGPNDLSMSLGHAGDVTTAEQDRATRAVAAAAQRAGKIFGMHAGTETLRRWADCDMRLVLNAIDDQILLNALRDLGQVTRELFQAQTMAP